MLYNDAVLHIRILNVVEPDHAFLAVIEIRKLLLIHGKGNCHDVTGLALKTRRRL